MCVLFYTQFENWKNREVFKSKSIYIYIYIYITLNKLCQTPEKCSMSSIGQSVYRIGGTSKQRYQIWSITLCFMGFSPNLYMDTFTNI